MFEKVYECNKAKGNIKRIHVLDFEERKNVKIITYTFRVTFCPASIKLLNHISVNNILTRYSI